MSDSNVIQATKSSIHLIRGEYVILDSDLAEIYGVETKRLNEQVKRNIHKFPRDFMFQLTRQEYESLRSHFATSNKGGRRYMPYVFTEHGVLQAANVIKSELADKVSVFVIRAFVEMRQVVAAQNEIVNGVEGRNKVDGNSEARIDLFFQGIKPKLYNAISNVLDSVLDKTTGVTLREEAQDILMESISHLKEKLRKTGLENEEIAARITKILAEAEKERVITRKTNAESEQLEFFNIVRKLRLVLEAQKLLMGADVNEIDRIDSFISILKELE